MITDSIEKRQNLIYQMGYLGSVPDADAVLRRPGNFGECDDRRKGIYISIFELNCPDRLSGTSMHMQICSRNALHMSVTFLVAN